MLGEARPVADVENSGSPMWSGRIMPGQGVPEAGRREEGFWGWGLLLWASPLALTLSSRAEVKHIGGPRPF